MSATKSRSRANFQCKDPYFRAYGGKPCGRCAPCKRRSRAQDQAFNLAHMQGQVTRTGKVVEVEFSKPSEFSAAEPKPREQQIAEAVELTEAQDAYEKAIKDRCPEDCTEHPVCVKAAEARAEYERTRPQREARVVAYITDLRKGVGTYPLFRKISDAEPLTTPEAIQGRVDQWLGTEEWEDSGRGDRARCALQLIGEACTEAAGEAGIPKWADVMAVEDLIKDEVIQVRSGKVSIISAGKMQALKHPGAGPDLPTWHPHYSEDYPGGKYATVEQQQDVLEQIWQQISRAGEMPIDPATGNQIELPRHPHKIFQKFIGRGEIKLPAIAWALLYNLLRPAGTRAIGQGTAANRMRELAEQGRLTQVSDAHAVFDPESWSIRTVAKGYAVAQMPADQRDQLVEKMLERREKRATERQARAEAARKEARIRHWQTGDPIRVPSARSAEWWLQRARYRYRARQDQATQNRKAAA